MSVSDPNAAVPVVTAVAEPRPDGQRITKAIIEFAGDVPDVDAIEVKGRTITGRKTEGSTVTLTLSEDDEAAIVLPHPPRMHGPGGKPGEPDKRNGPGGERKGPPRGNIPPRKRRPVSVSVRLPGQDAEIVSTKACQPVIDEFASGKYKGILYNLFVPKHQEPGKRYPLVMFIPDASANGSDPLLALVQGIGATIWAEPSEQEKRPCYVLAIQIPQSIRLTRDDYTCAPELAYIKELLDQIIAEHNVDTDRVYTTGQSQGCMASCELNCLYPGLFAASLIVSGHWDAERMSKLVNARFFIGLSEGGLREYPSMNAMTDGLEKNGVKISRVRLNFRDGWDVNEKKVRSAQGDAQVVYVCFEAATIFPDDGIERQQIAHHSRGWELTYQLESAREWIFRQHK